VKAFKLKLLCLIVIIVQCEIVFWDCIHLWWLCRLFYYRRGFGSIYDRISFSKLFTRLL